MPTLDWLNRDAAFKIAKEVPYRLLEEVSEHRPTQAVANVVTSDAAAPQGNLDLALADVTETIAPTRDNLLIRGDNLEALKALLPF